MPNYSFKCQQCNHESDKLLSISRRDEPVQCSKCGNTMLRVVASPVPSHFKGQGWTPKYHGQKEFRPRD